MVKSSTAVEPHFSIRTVARHTGIKPDTIRKWEQRYDAVQPLRTAGNTRRYSAADIERLSALRALTELGHPIRELAARPTAELSALQTREQAGAGPAKESAAPPELAGYETLLEHYLTAVHRFDTQRALELLTRAAALLEPGLFADQIAVPALRRIGDEWAAGAASVAHEHLVSAQLRRVLSASLAKRPTSPGASRVLLATPAGHRHEFGLLIAAHLVAARGLEPIELGVDLPERELHSAVDLARAELLVLSILREPDAAEAKALGAQIARLARRVPTWVGLPQGHPLERRCGDARLFHDFTTFDLHLSRLDQLAR